MGTNLKELHQIRPFLRLSAAAGAALLLLGGSSAAFAQDDGSGGDRGSVFVQSNDLAANAVLVYHRNADGTLTQVATVPTGGQGGRLDGAMSDPLGSQGSLELDPEHHLLIGVNAGSNTIYAFDVDGGRLANPQVVDSGGVFPVSVAVHGNLVYALNARGAGSVQGYRIDHGKLVAVPGSNRSLGLAPNPTPTEFLTTPGDVAFTPNGDQLIVTTKGNGSHIDVFQVLSDGTLSAAPVMNPSQTPVPFAITFDAQRQLVIGEAGTSNVSTYVVQADGSLSPVATASDGQVALCWIARDHDVYFVSNTGSGTESAFRIDSAGHPMLLANNPVGPGPIDIAVPHGGRVLYVELGGNGTIAELRVGDDGTLTPIGTVAGHFGEEGIVTL
jgi:6-phosphogluconolactonase (cycloisomerase 2 family)